MEEIEPLQAPVVPEPAPVLEPEPEQADAELSPPVAQHPLQPGGKRFEQVYAQSKQAQRELQDERERRIKLEAQLEVLNKTPQASADKEYDLETLEAMISQGQITRSDAYRHREEVFEKRLLKKVKDDYQRETSDAVRFNTLNKTFADYLSAVPEIQDATNVRRQQIDQEFDLLVRIQGRDAARLTAVERKAFEVNALRNILGPAESLSRRLAPGGEMHQGSIGGVPTRTSSNPDQKLLDELSPRQVQHYNRMFATGKYPGKWKDVVEELKFVPPASRR